MQRTVVTHVLTHSDLRDRDRFPNANDYTLYLHDTTGPAWTRSVCNVAITEAIFPKTQPCIDTRNNVLQFRERGTGLLSGLPLDPEQVHTVELPVGNYDAGTLIQLLNAAMIPREDGSHGTFGLQYTFDLNTLTGALRMSTNVPGLYTSHAEARELTGDTNEVQLAFGTGDLAHRSIRDVLGHRRAQDTPWNHEFVSEGHLDLSSSPFVDVIVEGLPTVACKRRCDPREWLPVLARIPLDVANFTNKFYKPEAYDILPNAFFPIALSELRIRLVDHRGDPYDTFGFDHYITFAITYLADARPDNAHFDATPYERPPDPLGYELEQHERRERRRARKEAKAAMAAPEPPDPPTTASKPWRGVWTAGLLTVGATWWLGRPR